MVAVEYYFDEVEIVTQRNSIIIPESCRKPENILNNLLIDACIIYRNDPRYIIPFRTSFWR